MGFQAPGSQPAQHWLTERFKSTNRWKTSPSPTLCDTEFQVNKSILKGKIIHAKLLPQSLAHNGHSIEVG